MSVSVHMQVLTTLNKFGQTSEYTAEQCTTACFSNGGREMMWKPHCCSQSTHLECAKTYMLLFGTSECPSCFLPFYGKNPSDRDFGKRINKYTNDQSPWTWGEVDWATPAFDHWSEMDDISWTWARVLDGCFIPHAEE